MRRGDVRTAILDVLGTSPEPINGYQVIQQIGERTHDAWRPSPGSVYPTIAQLEDAEDLKQVIKQTVGAIVQVATQGTPEQRRKAVQILAHARRSLYGLLAEGPDSEAARKDEGLIAQPRPRRDRGPSYQPRGVAGWCHW